MQMRDTPSTPFGNAASEVLVTKRIVVVVSVLMLFGLFALVAGCGGSELPDNAVAQVGDVYVTQEQLDARVADFEAQYAGSIPDEATDPGGVQGVHQGCPRLSDHLRSGHAERGGVGYRRDRRRGADRDRQHPGAVFGATGAVRRGPQGAEHDRGAAQASTTRSPCFCRRPTRK